MDQDFQVKSLLIIIVPNLCVEAKNHQICLCTMQILLKYYILLNNMIQKTTSASLQKQIEL